MQFTLGFLIPNLTFATGPLASIQWILKRGGAVKPRNRMEQWELSQKINPTSNQMGLEVLLD